MELTRDIFTLPFKEAEAVIKNKFQALALSILTVKAAGSGYI
jgi:hypothetical protein